MKELKRLKSYKALNPIKTVVRIKGILKGCNILMTEYNSNFHKKFYSCRVNLKDVNLKGLEIGTNGKGITIRYSLASGYAEFMERLQNNYIIRGTIHATKRFIEDHPDLVDSTYLNKLHKKNLVLDFNTAPDEKYLSVEEIIDNTYDQLRDFFKEENKLALKKIMNKCAYNNKLECLPYYYVNEKSIKYLPWFLRLQGTTGMCAGNTKKEALIQGICEIFERYAIKKIYIDELTPPTIPFKYFEGTEIYRKIIDIENNQDIKIVIKDCSLRKNLPVIGTLIIYKKENKYSFTLGADPSPITSLERCLTETFQGSTNNRVKASTFIHLSEDPFKSNNENSREQLKIINFNKTRINGTGKWPNSIFSDKESYQFDGFEHPVSRSDEEDLNYLINKTLKLGYDVFVRDVSFLGFPAFHVCILGMSERYLDNCFHNEFIKEIELKKNLLTLLNLKMSDKRGVRKLANSIENYGLLDARNIFVYNVNHNLNRLRPELLLSMLFYRINNYEKAFFYINEFLKIIPDSKRPEYIYFYCMRDFLKLKIDNYSKEDIKKTLVLLYGKEQSNKVMDEFKDPAKLFDNINLPTCFNCSRCEIESDCRYFDVLKYEKILQEKNKGNIIDQSNIEELFKLKVMS